MHLLRWKKRKNRNEIYHASKTFSAAESSAFSVLTAVLADLFARSARIFTTDLTPGKKYDKLV